MNVQIYTACFLSPRSPFWWVSAPPPQKIRLGSPDVKQVLEWEHYRCYSADRDWTTGAISATSAVAVWAYAPTEATAKLRYLKP